MPPWASLSICCWQHRQRAMPRTHTTLCIVRELPEAFLYTNISLGEKPWFLKLLHFIMRKYGRTVSPEGSRKLYQLFFIKFPAQGTSTSLSNSPGGDLSSRSIAQTFRYFQALTTSSGAVRTTTKPLECKPGLLPRKGVSFYLIWLQFLGNWHFKQKQNCSNTGWLEDEWEQVEAV